MSGNAILFGLQKAGLRLTVVGDRVKVTPLERITPELRALIREHKPAILAQLLDDRRHCADCRNCYGGQCRITGFQVIDFVSSPTLHTSGK